MPLVMTFSSFLPDVRRILREKRAILHRSREMRKIFPRDPLVAYRRGRNLRDVLVHQKTARSVSNKKGREDCGKGCVICRRWYSGDTLGGPDGPVYYDKSIGCRSKNVVYGLLCNSCEVVVYVGQTGDKMYTRMENHLSSIRGNTHTNKLPVSRHFNRGACSIDDVVFVGLERVWGRSETERKVREQRWVELLGTNKAGGGENVRRK